MNLFSKIDLFHIAIYKLTKSNIIKLRTATVINASQKKQSTYSRTNAYNL